MDFSYEEYEALKWKYPEAFKAYNTLDSVKLKEQEKVYEDNEGLKVGDVLSRLEARTTSRYFGKVDYAQRKAMDYAEQVFPTYKFILPDALIDDWLSTVDMHNNHPSRDHSLHQSLAAYIVAKFLGFGNPAKSFDLGGGNNLLELCARQLYDSPEMEYLREYVKEIDSDFDNKRDKYDMAWARDVVYEASVVSALFHDMGYPWQYVNKLCNSIDGANYKDVMTMMTDPAKALNEIDKKLLVYPFYGYDANAVKHPTAGQRNQAEVLMDSGLKQTHGTPGALGFSSLNHKIRQFGKTDPFFEASFRLVMDWAAVGIMMHDMPKVYWGEDNKTGIPKQPVLRLDFRKDPLSCLVSLADILEEFHRPSALFKSINKGTVDEFVSVTYDFACKGSRIEIEDDTLVITYIYYDEAERGKSKGRREDEVRDYLNPQNGYLNLGSWGVKDAKCETEVSVVKAVKR